MKSLNDEFDIRLFSHLIQTILCCRLIKKTNINQQIASIVKRLQSSHQKDKLDLNFCFQIISKLHENSQFNVFGMLKNHFQTHETNKYCIYLQIFTLHNQRQQQELTSKFNRNRLLEKWIFKKSLITKINSINKQENSSQSDLVFNVLSFLKDKYQFLNNLNFNNTEINNTTVKGYQLVIKSYCTKKNKFVVHVLHLQKSISQIQDHNRFLKSSLLQLPNYWQKSYHFQEFKHCLVGCYFHDSKRQARQAKDQVQSAVLQQPNRKMSSSTKPQEKQKESSSSSFKFSLENFSFRLSGNKGLKHSSMDQPIRKTSEQITQIHRPRYQSIYESKDEQMNIFILSPRKLSQQESPKIKYLQQKQVHFQITDHKGISQQMIEQFMLEPDEQISNGSSQGFEMLQQNDQLDSIKEQSQRKLGQKQKDRIRRQLLLKINQIEEGLFTCLRSMDKSQILI